jgi:GR25 family glycosyltransferase involved in LPS biosynthesis
MKNAIKPFENIIDFEFVFNEYINPIQLITNHFIKFFPYNNFSNKLYNFTNNCYNKGTLGCMYGHYLVYKKILEENLDKAIVLEDNVSFCLDFDIKIKYTLENIMEDWDIIHLFSSKSYEEIEGFLVHYVQTIITNDKFEIIIDLFEWESTDENNITYKDINKKSNKM